MHIKKYIQGECSYDWYGFQPRVVKEREREVEAALKVKKERSLNLCVPRVLL